jgi:glycosyltransferase involved in cell wall biosynthesis
LRPAPKEIVQQAPPAAPSAIYVGRLERDTGVPLYLEAVRILRKRWNLSLPLHVYGDGALRAALADYATAHALSIAFHGAAADAQEQIGAHTLAFVSGRMTIHEALARRRPVIAAYVDPIRADYVRGESFSPFIATAGSGAEIAAHAARLIEDRSAWAEMTERGWQHVQALSWQRTAEAYVEFWSTRTRSATRPIAWSHRVGRAWALWRLARRHPRLDRKATGKHAAPTPIGWPAPSGMGTR